MSYGTVRHKIAYTLYIRVVVSRQSYISNNSNLMTRPIVSTVIRVFCGSIKALTDDYAVEMRSHYYRPYRSLLQMVNSSE